MTELERLAQWHDSKANFWRNEAIVKLPTESAEHSAAAATIRAALTAIEAFIERHDSGGQADTNYVAGLMRAALTGEA